MTEIYDYARVSTEPQANGTSLEMQLANCEEYAKKVYGRPIPKDHIHVEPGKSGAELDRPQLQSLLHRLQAGDVVIVNTADRLTRSLDGLFEVRAYLKRIGAHCISVQEDLDVATAILSDLLKLMITGYFSEFELQRIGDRMEGGRRARMQQGEAGAGGNVAAFGFSFEKRPAGNHIGTFLEVNPQEAEIVALIYHLFLDEGLSSKKVALKLNALGIPSPAAGRGKPSRGWYPGRVRQILKSETCSGVYHWGDIAIPVPALVSEERRLLAVARLAENVRMAKRAGYEYLLAGLIRCLECNHTYTASMHRSGARLIGYYSCEGRLHPGMLNIERCQAPTLKLDDVEPWLWGRAVNLVSDPARIERYLDTQAQNEATDDEAELFMLAARIKGLELEKVNLWRMGARAGKEAADEALKVALAACDAEMAECRATQAALESRRRSELVRRAYVRTTQERLAGLQDTIRRDDLPFQLRREIVLGLVQQIGVGTDKVQVAYKLTAAPQAEGGALWKRTGCADRQSHSTNALILTETFDLADVHV